MNDGQAVARPFYIADLIGCDAVGYSPTGITRNVRSPKTEVSLKEN